MNAKIPAVAVLMSMLVGGLSGFVKTHFSTGSQSPTIYSFNNGNDGSVPYGGLVEGASGVFYGVAQQGGQNTFGTVFKVTSAGAFTTLHSFPANSDDGSSPDGTLIKAADGNFYGTTKFGGVDGRGIVFKITPDGNYANLCSFRSGDGRLCDAALMQASDGNLYGTTYLGGSHDAGTVFKVVTDGTPSGTTLTTIYSFTGNNDGGYLQGSLVQGNDGNLYGATYSGGPDTGGVIFKITTAGVLTVLNSSANDPNHPRYSRGGLIKGTDGNFYGTGNDRVFKMVTDGTLAGTTVTTLHTFQNSPDGAGADDKLLQASDGNFYGTTELGGVDHGTIFKITPGGDLTVLYSFGTNSNDGVAPFAELIQGHDGYLYGTTKSGGGGNFGTVFKLLGPPLPIPTVFDAVTDFNSTNPQGPNQTWQYGYTEADADGTGFTNYSVYANDAIACGNAPPGLHQWSLPADNMAVDWNSTGADMDYCICVRQQPDILGLHPGIDGRKTVVRWKAPENAAYSIQGRVQNIDHASSDFTIVRNGDVQHPLIDRIAINSGACHNSDTVVPFSFSLTVNAGDTIDFRLGRGDNDYSYDSTGFAATITRIGPPAPAHGGPSETSFKINGSTSPQGIQPDSVLRFSAVQSGIAASLHVRVQSTTTPCDEMSWTDLPNGRGARMFFDAASGLFILNSLDYPRQNNVYFRAIASAPGYPDSISNTVPETDCPNTPPPGLNLASSTPRLPPTSLFLIGNGSKSDLDFDAIQTTAPNGVALRIQSTTNPDDEFSWTDLNDGQSGHMQRSTNPEYPDDFILLANNLPSAHGIYYRALANLSGYVDSISNVMGPLDLTQVVPPNVVIQPPAGLPGSGDGHDICHPVLVAPGSFHFGATAQTNRSIRILKLKVNGSTVDQFNGQTGAVDYTTSRLGDYLLEGFAIDDLNATSRGDRPPECNGNAYTHGPLYVRVVPAAADRPGTPKTPGHVYYAVQNGYWDDLSTWSDQNGNPVTTVPGPDDLAVIDSKRVNISRSITVGSLSMIAAEIENLTASQFNFEVLGNLLLTGPPTFTNPPVFFAGSIDIYISDKFLLLNSSDAEVPPGVSIHNLGDITLRGAAGLRGAGELTTGGKISFGLPISGATDAATNPAAGMQMIEIANLTKSGGLLTSDGSSLIGHDGASLIGHDGASVVSAGGGNVVSAGGGNLIGHDGASLIGHDGASLIGHDGASIVRVGTSGANHPRSSKTIAGSGAFTQTGGETQLNSINIIGPVTLNGGALNGTGIIQGDLTNNGGTIAPGHSAGIIGVTGNFTQGANGKLVVDDGGRFPSQFDQLQVAGSANLGGNLTVHLSNGYMPDVQDTFSSLAYNSVNGNFDSVSANTQVMLTPNGLLMNVDPSIPITPATPTASAATNISGYSFAANWITVDGATGYRLDVSTDPSFASYVPSYQNRNAGNVVSYVVKGLHPNTTYYYRVRAYNSAGTSDNSNSITVATLQVPPTPTPTPKPRPTPGITPTPTPRPSSTPK